MFLVESQPRIGAKVVADKESFADGIRDRVIAASSWTRVVAMAEILAIEVPVRVY
jgi:hypothetical protein